MPELPRLLSEAAEAAERLRAAEASYDETRDEFRQAIERAHDAGATLTLIGQVVGLSRQRVAQLLEKR